MRYSVLTGQNMEMSERGFRIVGGRSEISLYAEIVDKWRESLSRTQKVSLKKAIDAAIDSIAKFRQSSRFRNLPDLRKRLDETSKRLV
jgi:hypothetical protein